MIRIDYPPHEFRTKKEQEAEIIFDEFRKRWVRLTPEEWVRQNFLQYLVQVKKYPKSLIAVEKEIELGELNKRFDILVYDNNHQPWMMIECKAMEVVLSEDVLQQVLRYSIAVPAPYLVVTNGSFCAGWKRENGQLAEQTELPDWVR